MQNVVAGEEQEIITLRERIAKSLLVFWAFTIWFPQVEIGGIGINDGTAFLVVFFALPSIIMMREKTTREAYVIIFCLSTILALSLTQISWVGDPIAATRFALRYGIILSVYLSDIALSLDGAICKRLAGAFVFGGVVVSLLVMADASIDLLGGMTFEQTSSRRSMGFLEHPNQLGIFIAAALPIVFITSMKRALNILAVLVLFSGMLFSGSKTNITMFLAVISLLPILSGGFSLRIVLIQMLAFTVLILGSDSIVNLIVSFFRVFNEGYADRFEQAISDPSSASTLVERYDLWHTAFELGKAAPLSGIGVGQSLFYLPYSHAHNFLAHYFMTLGVPGAACISVIFLALFLKKGNRNAPDVSRFIKATVLVFFVANLLSDSIAGRSIDLLGLIICLSLISGKLELTSAVKIRQHAIRL